MAPNVERTFDELVTTFPFLPRKTNLKIRNIRKLASILFIPIFGFIMNETLLLLFKPEITFTALWKKIGLGPHLHKDNSTKALMKSPCYLPIYIFYFPSLSLTAKPRTFACDT